MQSMLPRRTPVSFPGSQLLPSCLHCLQESFVGSCESYSGDRGEKIIAHSPLDTLAFFLAEASAVLAEGASIESIDHALTDFG